MPDANVDSVTAIVVPPAEPVSGGSGEGSHIDQVDGPDACRQPTSNADGNQTSARDDHPARKDNGGPEGDCADGEPQVDPPEYRSFGHFKMTEDGLVAPVGPQQVQTRICAAFEVIGRARDPHGNGWGKLIRWADEDSRRRTHLVSDADLHREFSALTARLADMGLHVTVGCGRPLAEYLSQVEVEQRVTCVSRTGWHEIGGAKCFILPHRNIAVPVGEKVLLNVGSAAKIEIAGTLEGWRNGVGQLVRDHSRAVVAVSAAFVGPLLALLNQEGGGVHFCGRSSIGKTTILSAAASVWGRGATAGGFVRSWRATANALEAEAAMHSDVALVLDEMGVVTPPQRRDRFTRPRAS
jgi:hypothetical protein